MNGAWEPTYGILLIVPIILPLLLALALCVPRLRAFAWPAARWVALPGLALTAAPQVQVDLPWLLFGMRLGMDATAQRFLLFTALLWLIAGLYAGFYLARDPLRHRFAGFFLATLSGNLGVILAQDVASFYLFFALMTFAAYGLVVHEGGEKARHAGRVYVTLAVIGEVLLFVAFMLAVNASGVLELQAQGPAIALSSHRDVIVALILIGFGIKAGMLSLHMWLPLAHPVAPTPASAVLSGVIIKAGLLGWLRFLPLSSATLPEWGKGCVAAGLAAAFYGAGVGLTQSNPKTVLAYSSISQMGLITVLVGLGLAAPSAWPLILTAILIFAAHHALAKGALFLGVGVLQAAGEHRRRVFAGLLLPALALAGAPFTSGALAKQSLKDVAALSPWPDALTILLPLSAIATTLLLLRFLLLLWREPLKATPRSTQRGLGICFGWALVGFAVVAPAMFPRAAMVMIDRYSQPSSLWNDLWPLLIGALLAGLFRDWAIRIQWHAPLAIPPGDLWVPLERSALWLWGLLEKRFVAAVSHWRQLLARWSHYLRVLSQRSTEAVIRWELVLQRMSTAGALFLLLACLFILAV